MKAERGHCYDLPPQVVDKYFMASATEQPFENVTARIICSECPIRVECLMQAILAPSYRRGVQGGATCNEITQMRSQRMRGVSAYLLAKRAVAEQSAITDIYAPRLKQGRFPDARTLV